MALRKSGTLVVRNLAQKVLFEEELKGQLSDGQWENSLPDDHWEQWCAADVVVAKPGEPVGRDFHVRRESYGFTRRDLLDVVGDRMLEYVRVALRIGYPLVDTGKMSFRSLVDYATQDTWPTYASAEYLSTASAIGFDRIKVAAVNKGLYSYKDMIKDLADLQRIIKVRRDTYAPTPDPMNDTLAALLGVQHRQHVRDLAIANVLVSMSQTDLATHYVDTLSDDQLVQWAADADGKVPQA